jgi:nucleobase:cation symporter-1, NCS1 family
MGNYDSHHSHAEVAADKAWSIEQHAIDPIPLKDRHGTPAELFKMWIGANTNYVVVVTGALALSQGLSLWQALGAILVGNLLGCFVLGLTTIMGPRTGTSGIMTSRSSFGQLGSFLPKAVSLVSALSWFSINSVVATQALETLLKMGGFHSHAVVWVSLAIILAAEILLAIFGHATIIAAEKWIAVVLAILFGGLAAFVLPHTSFAMASAINHGGGSVSTWLIAMGIIFSYPIGWANFASDYSRYFPAETSWKKIVLAAGGGQFAALMFCEIIGVLFATALGGTLGDDPVSQLSRFLPTWFIVPLLFSIILGGIAANVPNGYTAGLGLLALRIPINRITSLAVIALFTLAFRVVTVFYGQFFDMYQVFLNYMVYWTAPWAAIVIVDYFMRRGRYQTDAWMQWGGGAYWYKAGVFWPGVIALLVGIVASLVFSNSPTYVSPLMRDYLGWGDLSFEFGLLSSALTYFVLARRNPLFRKAADNVRMAGDVTSRSV